MSIQLYAPTGKGEMEPHALGGFFRREDGFTIIQQWNEALVRVKELEDLIRLTGEMLNPRALVDASEFEKLRIKLKEAIK